MITEIELKKAEILSKNHYSRVQLDMGIKWHYARVKYKTKNGEQKNSGKKTIQFINSSSTVRRNKSQDLFPIGFAEDGFLP